MSPFKHNKKIVAYYRVSTERQGKSGLGLEAQQALVEQYARNNGCEIVGAFIEAETGTKASIDNRPQLQRALAQAKKARATLVISVLDRLARNVAFVSALMETGVPFVCAESPNDDRFTLHIKASVGEEHARKISETTKNALAAAKARGVKLGTNNLTDAGRIKGAMTSAANAKREREELYGHIIPTIRKMKAEGAGFLKIAKALNAAGETTRGGGQWNATQVRRIVIAD